MASEADSARQPREPEYPAVLMRQTRGSDDVSVMGVYTTEEALLRRLERVRKANGQYVLREIGPRRWEIGPEEDEGFFGHKPVVLYAVPTKIDDGATDG